MKDNESIMFPKEMEKSELAYSDFNTQPSESQLSNKRDLATLVDYYRIRVEAHEKERNNITNLIEQLKKQNKEIHDIEWETKRRNDERTELQEALSDSNIALNAERRRVMKYSNEIENSKGRTNEDRRRICQLYQLAEPIEQTIKLGLDRVPEKTEKYSNFNLEIGDEDNYDHNSLSIKRSLAPNGKNKKSKSKPKSPYYTSLNPNKKSANVLYRVSPSDEKQKILRTVLFSIDAKEVEMIDDNRILKSQIEEMRIKYDNQISKMEAERKLRDEEFRLQSLLWKEKHTDLLKQNQKMEKLNIEIAKDIFNSKYYTNMKEKQKYEELEVMKAKNELLQHTIEDLMKKNKKEKEYIVSEYKKKTREITTTLCGQARTQEENGNLIKEQYKQIQKIYNSKVKDIGEKVTMITAKCKRLESLKNLQVEGYINEISLMRKRLKSYEDYVTKLRKKTEVMGIGDQKINKDQMRNNKEERQNNMMNNSNNLRESNDDYQHQEGAEDYYDEAYDTNKLNMYNQQGNNLEMIHQEEAEDEQIDDQYEEEENNKQLEFA